jgi:hypothetical protein
MNFFCQKLHRKRCAKAHYHGAGTTCQGVTLVSHCEPAVSYVRKLEDTTFGWQSDQVRQTVGALPLYSESNKSVLSCLDINSPWGGVNLEFFSCTFGHFVTGPYWKPQLSLLQWPFWARIIIYSAFTSAIGRQVGC